MKAPAEISKKQLDELGFLSREEVLGELEQAGGCLASEYVDTKESCAELSQLMNDIEDDVYDVVKKEG